MLNQTLANKYRPKNFLELQGQDTLVKILSNAITTTQIANAYLLTGIRGIGKTTTARLIAKTINCTDIQIKDSIPVSCEKCKNCVSINEFNHPDVIEIDAASKTGVNDVREIIENSKYKAILGTYKIYIVDEVHMLSSSAFNALLKTLEEPPQNVLFIFATTEVHKIPATVISRCQRFDLSRFTALQIAQNLEKIGTNEKINFNKDGLNLIAKFSEGSVRDSLSLLETINLYKDQNEQITPDLVNSVLGVPSMDSLYKLVQHISAGETKESLAIADTMYKDGSDILLILEELLHICNKISKSISITGFLDKVELFDYEKSLIKETQTKLDIISITNIWKMLFNGLNEIKASNHPFNVFEMILIRACHLYNIPPQKELLDGTNTAPKKVETKPQKPILNSFKDVTELLYKNQELVLYKQLTENVKLISFKQGEIEVQAHGDVIDNLPIKVNTALSKFTGDRWSLKIHLETKNPTQETLKNQELEQINNNEVIKSIYENYPGTKIKNIVKVKDQEGA